MAEVDRGMDVGEMKRLLTKSKTEPVNVAVGQDGKSAVMMLHKMKQPKAVSKDLEGKFKDLKNARWGTAFVDTDDPKLVILTLNRAASGLGAKLKKTLKGTGFSKVRIQLEDGSIAEDVGEEDEEQKGEAQASPNAPEAPVAHGPTEQNQPQTDTQAETQPNETQQFDSAALTQRLTGLVKEMIGVLKTAPERQGELKDLASKAQTAIKAGEESAATQAIDTFEAALQGGTAPNGADTTQTETKPTGPAAPNAAVLQKSRTAWVAARKRIEDEIGKLQQAMTKHYDGEGFAADLDKVFQAKVGPILTSLDQSLATKLDEVGKNTDPGQHEKLVGEAQQIIGKYESFIASDPLIPQLDQNPFVPLQIQKTLTATLEALKKSVR